MYNDDDAGGENGFIKLWNGLKATSEITATETLDFIQQHPIQAIGFALMATPEGDVTGTETALSLVDASAPVGRLGSEMYVRPGTNSPGEVSGTEYSGHAFDQMQGRGLTPSVVQDAIDNGVATEGRNGVTIYTTNQARVVVNSNGKVITAMPQ